jgi:hypothetical protein
MSRLTTELAAMKLCLPMVTPGAMTQLTPTKTTSSMVTAWGAQRGAHDVRSTRV